MFGLGHSNYFSKTRTEPKPASTTSAHVAAEGKENTPDNIRMANIKAKQTSKSNKMENNKTVSKDLELAELKKRLEKKIEQLKQKLAAQISDTNQEKERSQRFLEEIDKLKDSLQLHRKQFVEAREEKERAERDLEEEKDKFGLEKRKVDEVILNKDVEILNLKKRLEEQREECNAKLKEVTLAKDLSILELKRSALGSETSLFDTKKQLQLVSEENQSLKQLNVEISRQLEGLRSSLEEKSALADKLLEDKNGLESVFQKYCEFTLGDQYLYEERRAKNVKLEV